MADLYHFSRREVQVVELLLQGKSNKQIALILGISEHTVEFHLKNIYVKLEVNSRTGAILKLGKSLGWKEGAQLGESAVEPGGKDADNKAGQAQHLPETLQETAEMRSMKKPVFFSKYTLLAAAGLLLIAVLMIVFTRSAPLSASGELYFSVSDTLYRMNLDGSDLKMITRGVYLSENFASDATQNKIYMSRWDKAGQILVLDLNSQKVSEFSDGPTDGGNGLSIDPASQKMYLGLYYAGVFVRDLKNSGDWKPLVMSDQLFPLLGQRGQLQIDSVMRHIYFRTAFNGDCGSCRYIWRADFEGGNLTRIIQANGGDALALDLVDRKMYFSDLPGDDTIKRANLDGSHVETLFSVPAPYDFCKSLVLDVAHGKMYMSLYDIGSNYTKRAIARANLDGSGYEIIYQFNGNSEDEASGGIALFP